MNRDYEPIAEAGKSGTGIRTTAILLFLAFVGGAIATGWLMVRYDLPSSISSPFSSEKTASVKDGKLAAATVPATQKAATAKDEKSAANGASAAVAPNMERVLANRVADLEYRLSQINVQAEAASGNAARAEGLLIAFAARRALDKGGALGYIEGQLRLRFGDAQPRAVATVIAAAHNPVTLEQLQSGLADLGDSLTVEQGDNDIWRSIQREVGELFILRKEGSPSPAPSQRLERARRYTEAGNIEAAIAEVQKLPGAAKADGWLAQAQRYHAARDALDLIENAAILEPRHLRTAEGKAVHQASPLAGQ